MFNGMSNFFASPDDKDEGFIRLTRNILISSLAITLVSSVIVALTSTSRGRVIIISVLIV